MIDIYGIPNCDTMKKARRWLDAHQVEYTFHDYRKDGVPEEKLRQWVQKAGWETLLNRRGATWRKLPENLREQIDENSAVQVMLENPSAIKRPVLENGGTLLIGFNEREYESLC